MNQQALESWAHRAAAELQAYADATNASGSTVPVITRHLLAEFAALRDGRPTRQKHILRELPSAAELSAVTSRLLIKQAS